MDPAITENVVSQSAAARDNLSLWMAGYSIVIFDYVLTFDKEVEYVWSSPWKPERILFFLNRYLPFIDIILFSQVMLNSSISFATCSMIARSSVWMILIGTMVSQTIITRRTQAIWRSRRRFVWILGSITALSFGFIVVFAAYKTVLQPLDGLDTPTISPQIKCRISAFSFNRRTLITLLVSFLLILINELVIFIMTVVKAREHIPKDSSPESYVIQLYRNGVLHCGCMLALTIINCVFVTVATPPYKTMFYPLQRALHSVFCNRFLLLISEQQKHRRDEIAEGRSLPTTSAEGGLVLTSIRTESDDFQDI
ncbi:hypothetical protein GALMADRAFT_252122 [Galerina marginata CBS 339.88]|uniref:DUF6533 domain-containing protein n=1 Tax=Galerina marginata (strain CBS 339.88) TaxID=685588 RepID=A0A067T1D3_GALM3|nr:hypothetical protein GALMADRAFT_252122 [Galerina marginata CBS 339.88]